MNKVLNTMLYSALALFMSATSANAATVITSFVGSGGDLGPSHTFGTIIAEAFNSGSGTANLYQSSVGNDLGLGVCNSIDDNGAACPSTSDSGYNNEIDNHGTTFDWIRLNVSDDISVGGLLTDIGLSSVQYRGWDTWSVWGNNTGTATFAAGDFIASGNTPASVYVNIDIPVLQQGFLYYFITTGYRGGTDGSVNESAFMVSRVTINTDAVPPGGVPVPPALWLLSSGLGGLLMAARRNRLLATRS